MKDELDRVQIEYLKLLQSISSRLEHEELLELLDEIQLFWYQKRNVMRMAARYLFKYNDTYFLTAATIFDAEDSDQNIFFLNGKYQVFDDPIPSYLSITSNKEMRDGALAGYIENLSEIIIEIISNEIKLLESSNENFFIIPLRYYLNLYSLVDSLDEVAKNSVISFFNEPVDLLRLSTIEDVEKIVDTKNIRNIFLFDGDDFSTSITERIEKYIEKNKRLIPAGLNHAQILYFALFGYLRQALDVIETSIQFNAIPFFRSIVPFSYFSQFLRMILQNPDEQNESSQIMRLLNKSTIEYLVYFEFSKRNDGNHTLFELKEKSKQIEFSDRLQHVENRMNNPDSFAVTAKKIGQITEELLS